MIIKDKFKVKSKLILSRFKLLKPLTNISSIDLLVLLVNTILFITSELLQRIDNYLYISIFTLLFSIVIYLEYRYILDKSRGNLGFLLFSSLILYLLIHFSFIIIFFK